MILELCKGVHCVELDESFQTHIYLQTFVSIQPRTSPRVAPDHLAEEGVAHRAARAELEVRDLFFFEFRIFENGFRKVRRG